MAEIGGCCRRRRQDPEGLPSHAEASEWDPLAGTGTSYSGGTADETRLLQQSQWINANSPWFLLAYNIGMTVLYGSTVSGAYFFVLSSHSTFSPQCYEQYPVSEALCNFSTLCLWTYPLFCLLLTVVLFGKSMLDTRLYYECLLNGVLLDFDNNSMNHPVVWLLFFWGLCTMLSLWFVGGHLDMAQRIFGMLAYFLPVASFVALFLSNWQVEAHLIPLPKYVETDPYYAVEVLVEASRHYTPEGHFRVAFETVNDALSRREEQSLARGTVLGPLKTARFFSLIADEVARETEHAREEAYAHHKESSASRFVTRVAGNVGLRSRPAYADFLGEPSRPEVLGIKYNCCKPYWVYRVLFHRRLMDSRSRSFRKWAYAYVGFAVFVVLLLVYAAACTLSTFLVFERLVPPDYWAVRHLNVHRMPVL